MASDQKDAEGYTKMRLEGRVLVCGHRGLPEGVAFEVRFEW